MSKCLIKKLVFSVLLLIIGASLLAFLSIGSFQDIHVKNIDRFLSLFLVYISGPLGGSYVLLTGSNNSFMWSLLYTVPWAFICILMWFNALKEADGYRHVLIFISIFFWFIGSLFSMVILAIQSI